MSINIFAEKKFLKIFSYILLVFFVTLAFSFSYTLKPLYDGTQNTYFLHGLTKAGFGHLINGWFATTTDPYPLFSLLVGFTYQYLSEYMFYIYFIIFLGIYLISIQGITSKIFYFDKSFFNLKFIINLTLIITLHSFIVRLYANRLFGGGGRGILTNLQSGVASQQILGNYFVPSLFAVLIIFSVYLFLKRKDLISLILLVLFVSFHPAYLLSSAIIVLSYMFIIAKEKNLKSSLWFGVLALILVLPIIIYTIISFAPTSAASLKESQNILIYHRISHHAIPERWIDQWLIIKIIIIFISLFIIKRTRIFFVVLFCLIFSVALTVIQIITGNNTLALFFPWRLSVFLVPLSFFIIVAAITSWAVEHFPFKGKYIKKIIMPVCLMLVIFVGAKGIEITKQRYHSIFSSKSVQIMKWVKNNKQKKDIYLVPPQRNIHRFGKFRLFTGVPIFVDVLTHPYKDIEVI